MSRKQCKEALDLYKRFVERMELVAKFLCVAEVCVLTACLLFICCCVSWCCIRTFWGGWQRICFHVFWVSTVRVLIPAVVLVQL